MKSQEFIEKLKLAESKKTIYIKGCFGAPMNEKNKKRYTNNLAYNKNRANMINACTADVFGFDCVNLIKAILWGWNADESKVYGGATYISNNVPDVSADGILKYCTDVSTDFSKIIPGEVVWMSGHVGVYVGDGRVIECTPKWTNNVQYSNLANIGYKEGNSRTWKKHGKLKWIDYDSAEEEKTQDEAVYYTVVKGDTLSKIGKNIGVKWKDIAELNGISFPYIIKVGQRLRIR